jgi:hypothetical protein
MRVRKTGLRRAAVYRADIETATYAGVVLSTTKRILKKSSHGKGKRNGESVHNGVTTDKNKRPKANN